MRRREFITLLSGAAAWPLAARAQERERMRRIGVLMPSTADAAEYQVRMAAFLQGLQQLGWSDGRNVRIDTRWAAGDANLVRKYAAELVALGPDVILAPGSTSLGPLLQATRTVPIVFTTILDPVGAVFARSSNGGLIVTAGSGSAIHGDLIIALAARLKLPAVYGDRHFVTDGGLISYGPNRIDQYRQAAGYIDRILKGEKPGDMPVQAPTKYELVINLKTAKALGLTVPPTLLASANEVIE